MSSDGEANAGRVEWAPLIGEIVTDQDRGLSPGCLNILLRA